MATKSNWKCSNRVAACCFAFIAMATSGCSLVDRLTGRASDAGATAAVVDAAPAVTGPTLAEVVAKHKAALAPRLAQRDAILKKLPPRLYADTLHAPAMDAGALSIAAAGANTAVVYPDDDKQDLFSRIDQIDPLRDCALIVAGETTFPSGLGKDKPITPELAEKDLGGCERDAFLLVMRSSSSTKPDMGGGGEFTPGDVEGDALLYDLGTGAFYGGVRFSAKNSAELKAKASDRDPLNEDLVRNTLTALHDAITKRIPGATVGTSG